ncbi:MAG: type II toxin-antitoxin system VapC family toxin [Betaproteobacteria bacterium]|nr:type II toxin-antitoxin system VapC family toxin [Betaproteobacteria bacterium]
MIVYFDTSALFKLFVLEAGSVEVNAVRRKAAMSATVLVTYAEVQAAFARRIREQPAIAPSLRLDQKDFVADWTNWGVIGMDQPLMRQAAHLADAFALRGYDSIQLAAAAYTQQQSQTTITFACFDERLNKAASLLGMTAVFL